MYNPTGLIKPTEFIFPFDDGEFDFIILFSVFTHMFSAEMQHYVDQVARILKPGAHGLITFLLLNPESELLIAKGKSTIKLIHEYEDGSRATNPDRLETAVGHQEHFVLDTFRRRGLKAEVSEHGSWCGRTADYYQDIIRISA